MKDKGITPLVNESHTLTIGDTKLILCASDDIKMGKPELNMLYEAREISNAFILFFPHSPDVLPHITKNLTLYLIWRSVVIRTGDRWRFLERAYILQANIRTGI